ncbi:MAG: hypothetical protein ACOZBZ_04645 [Patescibacteria group bacterium]
MSAQFLTHLLFLLSAVFLTFAWTQSPILQAFTLQLIAILVIFYFLNHLFAAKKLRLTMAIDGLILSLVTLLLVSQTGGLSSPLFFLIYILLFGLSLLFDPLVTLIFALALCFFFYQQVVNLNAFLQVIGLLLITPLALFFGRQYLKVLEEKELIKILSLKKQSLEKEVGQQEEDTLLWISLTFKEHVLKILDTSSNLLADVGRLSQFQKENLQKIHESAKRLLKLGERLKEKIEG